MYQCVSHVQYIGAKRTGFTRLIVRNSMIRQIILIRWYSGRRCHSKARRLLAFSCCFPPAEQCPAWKSELHQQRHAVLRQGWQHLLWQWMKFLMNLKSFEINSHHWFSGTLQLLSWHRTLSIHWLVGFFVSSGHGIKLCHMVSHSCAQALCWLFFI